MYEKKVNSNGHKRHTTDIVRYIREGVIRGTVQQEVVTIIIKNNEFIFFKSSSTYCSKLYSIYIYILKLTLRDRSQLIAPVILEASME